jgi:hypothetical protein
MLGCVAAFAATNARMFGLTVLAGILLAGLCWYFCSVYTHLWNRQYRVSIWHHLLCAFASALTLAFVVMFPSLGYTKEVAVGSINLWQLQLDTDQRWATATFGRAYNKIKDLGTEDFSDVAPLGTPGVTIPLTRDESIETFAGTYANEACRNFNARRPFLSKIVWSRAELPSATVLEDTQRWFQTHSSSSYPARRAVALAADQIKMGLEPQTPRVVEISRIALVVLFVFIQAIPFGIIGWAAYVDIKARI